mmetsp:Transcript_11662/g.17123  ORF Transcript_11662/g.17123 Transcript_11662/m.17123 type:complete len:125 (-) Transcript_11662:332-706(-)
MAMRRSNRGGSNSGSDRINSNNRSNNGGSSRRRRRPRRPRSPPPPIPPQGQPGRGCFRELLLNSEEVWVVQKADQRSGHETKGTIDRLLTKSPYHPRGIKVMLTSGQVGRVTRIVNDGDIEESK